jgi:tetratricopeptide (TPR) repeat protein
MNPSRILTLSLAMTACATAPSEAPEASLTQSVASELGMAAAASSPSKASAAREAKAPVEDPAPLAVETASEPGESAVREASAPAPEATAGVAAVEAAQDAAADAGPDASAQQEEQGTELPSEVLAILRSPAFQEQFAQSYIAETELEPTVTLPEREDLQEVLNAIAGDDLDGAIALLTERGGPAATATFDFMLGNIHFQREDNEAAIAAYDLAVAKYPKFLRAWKNKGICHIRSGDFEGAIGAFTRVLQLGRADAVTYGLLGWAYGNAERFLPSESAYRMAILLDPETADFQMGLARALFKQGRFEVAAALVGELLLDRPDSPELWLLQANAYIGMKEPMRAAENFEIVDTLGASNSETLNNLADIYRFEELYTLSVERFLAALDLDAALSPERAIAGAQFIVLKGANEEGKQLLAGIEARRDGALTEVQRTEILRIRSRIAAMEGASEEEASVLEEIVALDPLDGDAMVRLGRYQRGLGQVEQAIFWYERAAQLDAHEAEAKSAWGQLLVSEGRYDEALPLLRRSLELKPRQSLEDYLKQVESLAKGR